MTHIIINCFNKFYSFINGMAPFMKVNRFRIWYLHLFVHIEAFNRAINNILFPPRELTQWLLEIWTDKYHIEFSLLCESGDYSTWAHTTLCLHEREVHRAGIFFFLISAHGLVTYIFYFSKVGYIFFESKNFCWYIFMLSGILSLGRNLIFLFVELN